MLRTRRGRSPVMVGRRTELDRLLSCAGDEDTAVVFVGGAAGVGKTRLLQELVERLPPSLTVVTAQADPVGAPGAGLVRELAPDVADPSDTEAVVASLVARLEPAGVVVLDDLHWADTTALTILERLAGERAVRLLVGTYRPEDLDRRRPLADHIVRLERRHPVTHVRLEPLDRNQVSDLLAAVTGRSPTHRLVETLYVRTGGNPFFLEELLGSLDGDDPEDLADSPLPWTLAELVHRQLAPLSAEERRVVETAAVLGLRVGFDLLAGVTGLDEDELLDVLRALVDAGLLEEVADDVFGFAHALVRDAAASGVLSRQRRRFHEAALQTLLDTASDDLTAVTHHAHAAGRLDVVRDCAGKAAAHALATGTTFTALGLAELGLEAEPDDPELLAIAAESAWLAGIPDVTDDHATHWREVALAHDDLHGAAEAQRLIVRRAWERDDPNRRHEIDRLREMADELGSSPAGARCLAALAQIHMLDGHNDQAVAYADTAIELARSLGLDDVRVDASVERESAMMSATDCAPESARRLRELSAEAEALGRHVTAARALHNAGLDWSGPVEESRTRNERMRSLAQRAGYDSLAVSAYAMTQSELAIRTGNLREALDAVTDAVLADIGCCIKETHYVRERAALLAECGRAAEAWSEIREVPPPPGTHESHHRVLQAAVAVLAGASAEADDALQRAVVAGSPLPADRVELLASALLAIGGDPEGLDRVMSEATIGPSSVAAPDDVPVWIDLILGLRAALDGADDDALEHLAGIADAALPPAVVGHALAVRGLASVSVGDRAGAERDAARAAELLGDWDGFRVTRLRMLEDRLDRRVRDPDDLTPREREVATLVSQGLTNGEIADRLFIARKTASVHVSNILAKVGVDNRTELAAWVIEHRLD